MGSQGIKWSGVGIQRWINRYRNLRIVSLPFLGCLTRIMYVSCLLWSLELDGLATTYTDAVMAPRQHKWRDTGNEILRRLLGFGNRSNSLCRPYNSPPYLYAPRCQFPALLNPQQQYRRQLNQNQRGDRGSTLSNNVVNVTRSLAITSRLGGIHNCTPRMRYFKPNGGFVSHSALAAGIGGA